MINELLLSMQLLAKVAAFLNKYKLFMSIIGIIYIIGAIIALIIGIYEMLKVCFGEHKYIAQYGMIAQMTLLSWITVIVYFYSKLIPSK